jgi:hypothetical protein
MQIEKAFWSDRLRDDESGMAALFRERELIDHG